MGTAVAVLAIARAVTPARWNLALGAWLAASPPLLDREGMAHPADVAWNNLVAGLLVALLALLAAVSTVGRTGAGRTS